MGLDKKYIEKLLNLYEEGETTLEQENELKAYFSSGNYDKEFEDYAMLFHFFESESKINYASKDKTFRKSSNYSWISIAASVCIVIGGLWYYTYQSGQQKLEEAKMAFETTQNALNLLSTNMNEGLEKLEYVEVFSEQKNKILK